MSYKYPVLFAQVKKDAPVIASEDAALERELKLRIRDFIEEDQFTLVFQPIFDFASERICGCEVLSRLNHPELGAVSPGKFVPIINELQLHAEFDCYVFRKSCQRMRQLRDSGKELSWLSCNFSRKTLSRAGVADELVRAADHFGVPHHCMGIELTEYENADNEELFLENLRELRRQDFLILIDDMGSGVTSARDLWSLPVDIVKLDRSLLLAAASEEGAKAFCKLVRLINGLGLQSLCEGIEKYADIQLIHEAGCNYGQGFLFSPPVGADDMESVLKKWSK